MKKMLSIKGILVSLILSIASIGGAFALNDNEVKVEKAKAATYTQTVTQYYSSIDWDKTGANLKTDLFNKIKISTAGWSYNGLWTAYQTTDTRSNGTLWDIYSNSTAYTQSSPHSGTSGHSGEGDYVNREHMIPQSLFDEAAPMVSDVHHVYPSDGYINGMRSNHPHAPVTKATKTSASGCKLGTGPTTGSTTVFEPMDEYKGDIARTYFYFVTCYQDKMADLDTFAAFTKNTYPSISSTYLSIYLQWAKDDPVSQKEIDRNNAAYRGQGNRNPFIDSPYAIGAIWDSDHASDYGTKGEYTTEPVTPTGSVTISDTSASIEVGATKTLTASASDSSTISWTTSDANVASISTDSGNSVVVTGVAAGDATITASATIGGQLKQKTCLITVTESGGQGGGDDPDPTEISGTYTKVTSLSSVTDGNYVICSGSTALSNTVSSDRLTSSSVTISEDSISNPAKELVWNISTSDDYKTIYNADVEKYAAGTGVRNKAQLLSSGTGDLSLWSLSDGTSSGTFEFVNKGNSAASVNATLRFNDGYGFACYSTGTGVSLTLYKQESQVTPAKTLIEIEESGFSEMTTTYTEGDYLDPSGLVLSTTYDDMTSGYIEYFDNEEDFTFNPDLETPLTTSDTTVTVGYAGLECEIDITVEAAPVPVTLSSISVSGQKTEFEVGDTFSFGGTVTATYSDASEDDVTASADFGGYDMSTAGNQTVTVSYTEGGITETTTYQITVSETQSGGDPIDPSDYDPYTSSGYLTYTKITSTDDIVSGKYYAIISEGSSVMFNGSLTTLDATGNKTSTGPISNSKFDISTGTDSAFLITESTNGYIIKSISGYYIGRTSNENGLESNTSNPNNKYINSISFSGGDVDICQSSAHLRYNTQSGQERFRYFKSASYTNQQSIQLYRVEIEQYAENFISGVGCDNGVHKPTGWSAVNTKYNLLSTRTKNSLASLGSSKTGDIVEQALAKYDFVVGKYYKTGLDTSYTDFMGRNPSAVYGTSPFEGVSIDNNTTMIIIVITGLAFSAVALDIVLRKKRKED